MNERREDKGIRRKGNWSRFGITKPEDEGFERREARNSGGRERKESRKIMPRPKPVWRWRRKGGGGG
jgi:hypothetical protein